MPNQITNYSGNEDVPSTITLMGNGGHFMLHLISDPFTIEDLRAERVGIDIELERGFYYLEHNLIGLFPLTRHESAINSPSHLIFYAALKEYAQRHTLIFSGKQDILRTVEDPNEKAFVIFR